MEMNTIKVTETKQTRDAYRYINIKEKIHGTNMKVRALF
jgi:hypothetical protein